MNIDVTDNKSASRYEGRIGTQLVGYCDYRLEEGRILLPHTETLPAYRGKGVADAIVKVVVDEAEERGLEIVPLCWFVEEFMKRRARAA